MIFDSIMKLFINSFINFSTDDFEIIDDESFNNFSSSMFFSFKSYIMIIKL